MGLKDSSLLRLSTFFGTAANSGVNIAVPWLVLETTGSSARAGIVLGISGISVVFTAPLIGGLIAVLGSRKVSVWSDVISASSVALFPIVNELGGMSLATLILIATFGAMFDPAGITARKTMIQRVAQQETASLQKLNGSYEAAMAVGWIVGPGGAALLIAAFSTNVALIGVAIFSFLAALCVVAMKLRDSVHHDTTQFSIKNVWGETTTGISAMWNDKPLLSLFGLYTLLSGLYMPVELVVLSRHFKDIGQPGSLGILLSTMSVGVVIGALLFHRAILAMTPAQLVMASMSTIGLTVCAMAPLPHTAVFAVIGLALGLAYGPVSPLGNYLVQRRIPERLQGPVYGAQFSLTHVATPIGALILGFVIESISIPITLFIVGLLFIVVTLAVGIWGPMRHLTAHETPS